jgi:NADH dehydrogenase [ubiquinone] 1 alpha subcomplex assembly factor 6
LINEREQHLTRTTFASLEDLEQYGEHTASSVYYMQLEALGIKDRELEVGRKAK